MKSGPLLYEFRAYFYAGNWYKMLGQISRQPMQYTLVLITFKYFQFGYQMLENKNNVHQEVEDLTVGTIKRQRSLSSGSSSSSELGSLQVY